MIHIQTEGLNPTKVGKLRKWLSSEERVWLEECVQGSVAAYQAQATNIAMALPHQFIENKSLPDAATIAMLEAARLAMFLKVLSEVSGNDFQFQTTKVSVQS